MAAGPSVALFALEQCKGIHWGQTPPSLPASSKHPRGRSGTSTNSRAVPLHTPGVDTALYVIVAAIALEVIA